MPKHLLESSLKYRPLAPLILEVCDICIVALVLLVWGPHLGTALYNMKALAGPQRRELCAG